LEYHHIPDDEICEFDFFQDQLTVHKYYFNFLPSPGLRIEHKPKGTLITVIECDRGDRGYPYSTVEICPTEQQPVRFHVQGSNDFMIKACYKNFCI